MANNSHIFGLRPSRFMDTSPFTGQTALYFTSASETNAMFKGDVVKFDATNRSSGLADVYSPLIPAITLATGALTTTAFRGVIAGFVVQPEFSQSATASLGTTYRLASTARYAFVVDSFDVVFEGEETGNSYVSDSNNAVSKNIDISYTAGSTITGVSGLKLDAATLSTSAVKPFRVSRYTQKPDNFGFTAADTNSRAHLDVIVINSDYAQATNGS